MERYGANSKGSQIINVLVAGTGYIGSHSCDIHFAGLEAVGESVEKTLGG